MTVRSDGTPRRLLEQAAPAVRPLAGAAPDALRQLVQELVQTTLERDFARFLGAQPYERAPERRGVRNGTRPRTLVTRVGRLELRVPRDRESLFEPAVFARYQRHEQALLGTLAECYLPGVSTRKVRSVVEALCGEAVSASLVSSATKRLDATLAAWRARRLDAQAMPYLIVDAPYERIRREGQVLSTAVLWVVGVRADGDREYLGCWTGGGASARTWSAVFRALTKRGLHGVRYVVSDEHAGLKAALQRHCPGAVQQRCQVHYLRNALATVTTPARQQELLAGRRDVWAAPTRAAAEQRGAVLAAALRPAHARDPRLPQRGQLPPPRLRARRRPQRPVGEAPLRRARLAPHQRADRDAAARRLPASAQKRSTHFRALDPVFTKTRSSQTPTCDSVRQFRSTAMTVSARSPSPTTSTPCT